MSTVNFEQIVQLADQLNPGERLALARHLLSTLPAQTTEQITLETILAEHQRRVAAGAFDHVESLRNKYANPAVVLSDEELHAGIREFANEWEQELDELAGDH